MIDAVMYGMIPRKKIATFVIAPPEKRSRNPTTPLFFGRFCSLLDRREVDERDREVGADPVHRHDQEREEDLVPEVGYPEHVPEPGEHAGGPPEPAEPTAYRLVRALPRAAGRRSPHGAGSTSTRAARGLDRPAGGVGEGVRLHGERHRDLAASEDLDEAALGDQAPGPQRRRGRRSSLPRTPSSVSRFTTAYSTRNGFLKPFAFGVRRAMGVWPPSKPGLTVPRAPWPFSPGRRSCRPCRRCPARRGARAVSSRPAASDRGS